MSRQRPPRSSSPLLRAPWRLRTWIAVVLAAGLLGCGDEIDSTPEKLDGTPSHEFEQDDLDAAEETSDKVKEYCADAVSEAQRIGCEAHVTEEDIP